MNENYRRLKQAETRDPVENAVYAMAALSATDRTKAINRFNEIYAALPYVPKLIEEPKKGLTGSTQERRTQVTHDAFGNPYLSLRALPQDEGEGDD